MLKDLVEKICRWGEERNLNDIGQQYLKLHEEVGELAKAILKNDREAIADAVGDCFVVAVQIMRIKKYCADFITDKIEQGFEIKPNPNHPPSRIDDLVNSVVCCVAHCSRFHAIKSIAEFYNLDLLKCVADVYEVISKRTGRTENGVFVKD